MNEPAERSAASRGRSVSTALRVTADTNVFYYLGAGALPKEAVVGAGEELWATPVNVLEVVAGVPGGNWEQRRDAARGIVGCADQMSLDPEEHLMAIMTRQSIAPAPNDSLWLHGAKALAGAASEAELLGGVADFAERVVRTVKPTVATATKAEHYDGFKNDIIDVCESLLPGYRAAVAARSQAPVVEKGSRKDVRAFLSSPEFVAAVFFAGLGERHRLCSGSALDLHSATTMDALRDLAPYCAVYGAYLRELLTARRKPEANDWGDLELFIFLQPETLVATAEKKWWDIAKQAGLGGLVRKIARP